MGWTPLKFGVTIKSLFNDNAQIHGDKQLCIRHDSAEQLSSCTVSSVHGPLRAWSPPYISHLYILSLLPIYLTEVSQRDRLFGARLGHRWQQGPPVLGSKNPTV